MTDAEIYFQLVVGLILILTAIFTGWAVTVTVFAIKAWWCGENVKQAIKPILEEF